MINHSKMAKLTALVPPTESKRLFYPPSSSNLSSALQQYINSDHPAQGQTLHSHILKTGFKPNINVSIKLLILYIKSSCITYARQVFDELPHLTLSAYNYMISGYLKSGLVQESYDLVRKQSFSGVRADGFTFSMILKGSTSLDLVGLRGGFIATQVHAQIIRSCVEGDDVLYTVLVDSYVKNGKVHYARRVFDLMSVNNFVCSTSMITGYMNEGNVDDAEDVFKKTRVKDEVVFNAMIEGYSKSIKTAKKAIEFYINMKKLGFNSTISTFASLIGACSALAAFEVGQQVLGQVIKTSFVQHIKIGSALIDMFSKCGQTEEARSIFDHMPERNVFSWTSMIDGYGKNGYPNEALVLFDEMLMNLHVKPNYVTFLSALSACAHSGLVSKGKHIFERMEKDYSMKPRMEHYACMIDLLGRAGRLNQALEFAINMPEKPNSDVWAALLSSGRLHGDVEITNLAAKELFNLSGNSRPGAYVALSNTLAEAGKWDSVSELRVLMKSRGISKGTGFSWVGRDGYLEAFHAG
ncbi:unnamed protein product [Cuscuta campestris]|uniref:Pentacotripeptide-repeat region of PRORP domain-containing protein n=1 Tax=Cuscuta campestris TaxID=132261 RepID=A0A484M356_9ASTE|nr:unnamed protein product [Cuscuta campestris]